jgi:hypothetical protein
MRHPSLACSLVACFTLVACKEAQEPSAPPSNASASTTSSKSTASAPASASTTTPALASARAKPSAGLADAAAAKAVAQKQGGTYWAAYLAKGASQDEPAMKAAVDAATARGLVFGVTFGFGSLACDEGAAAALKASGETKAIAAYFASEADAKAFAATVVPAPLGVVKIKAMCRD